MAVRDDDGRILLLALLYTAILTMLILVVTAATAVHLERNRLQALADLTALHAADAMSADTYLGRSTGSGPVVLSDEAVRATVTAHLAASPEAARFAGLEVVAAHAPGGAAEVRLRAVADVPFAVVAREWVALEAVARARAG